MKIDLDFNVGDKIWIATCFSYTRELECLKCKATGSVTLMDGTSMQCGVCGGRKTHCVNRPMKFRPEYRTITGFDIHNKNGTELDIWVYTTRHGNFTRPGDLIKTFIECRKKCRELNEKYGWPKADHVYEPYWERHDMYWGYRVGKNVKS